MKRLIVAVDVGRSSERAFARAVQLAGAHRARLTLVHVVNDQLLAYGEEDSRFAAEMMGRAEDSHRRNGAGQPKAVANTISQKIVLGRPWEKLLEIAKSERADLIVLGLHRVSPIKDIFVGTTAERIVRLGTLPVLIVRDESQGPYRNVLVGTDFSASCSHALSAALDVAPRARFKIAHVFETPFPAFVHFSDEETSALQEELTATARKQTERDLRRFMKSHLGARKPAVQLLVQSSEVAGGMAAVVKAEDPDLLVVGSHGRSRILGAMLGSTVGTFLNDPPCDVLVSR
jgi:nucleotide-binding universal stress UspA family protein